MTSNSRALLKKVPSAYYKDSKITSKGKYYTHKDMFRIGYYQNTNLPTATEETKGFSRKYKETVQRVICLYDVNFEFRL